jgi:O-antigen/teichoic acid export membrane protein
MQEQLRRLWNIYATVRYPPLVRLPVAARRRRFLAEGGLVWAAFAGAGAALFLAAYWLIPIILPPSYTSSLGVMGLLIAALVVSIPGSLAELYFRMQQDERRQYLLRIASAVVGVLAPAVLVLRWGAYGAASGRLLASLAFSIVGVGLFLGDRAHQKTADAAQTTQNEIASPPKNGDSQ